MPPSCPTRSIPPTWWQRDRSDHDPVTIGFLGGVTTRKGFDLVPKVAGAFAEETVQFRLYVNLARRGASPAIWEQLDPMPSTLVDPVGKVEDVRVAYAAVDIVWVASRAESFCRVAAEAMMNGIPVVAGDIPPLRDLLGDDEAGLLYPVEDHEAAVVALRRLARDPALRRRLGEAGRERSVHYSPAAVAEQLLGLYGVPYLTEAVGRGQVVVGPALSLAEATRFAIRAVSGLNLLASLCRSHPRRAFATSYRTPGGVATPVSG